MTNMEKVEMDCNRKGSSSLVFFLTGLGVGIASAVLLAPRSGASTRRLIGLKVEEGEEWAKSKATAAQDYVKGRSEELRGRVKEVAEVISRP
jgi:gas vesicle protein